MPKGTSVRNKSSIAYRKTRPNRTEKQREAANENLTRWREDVKAGRAEAPRRGRQTALSLYMRKGVIADKQMVREVNATIASFVKMLGGERKLDAIQRSLLRMVREDLIIMLLAEKSICQQGSITTDQGEIRSSVRALNTYQNTFRQVLADLGLIKRGTKTLPVEGLNLDEVLQGYKKEPSGG